VVGGAMPRTQERRFPTPLGANIDRLRKECGWSFDELANRTDIDKKGILNHVNKGTGARPSTLKRYAQAFTGALGRPVTVADLEHCEV
jgi:transcriptional regulator with XRE-family HTH domain